MVISKWQIALVLSKIVSTLKLSAIESGPEETVEVQSEHGDGNFDPSVSSTVIHSGGKKDKYVKTEKQIFSNLEYPLNRVIPLPTGRRKGQTIPVREMTSKVVIVKPRDRFS